MVTFWLRRRKAARRMWTWKSARSAMKTRGPQQQRCDAPISLSLDAHGLLLQIMQLPDVKKVERMLNQNTFDDVLQDFKYWEDPSDEFKVAIFSSRHH